MPTRHFTDSGKAALLAWVLLINAGGAFAMGTMYLFSAVRGVVIQHGQPVAGATVEREFRWAWKGETGRDEVKTDTRGEFSFPLISRSSFWGSLMPHEPAIEQTILIRHGGKTYKAWMYDKGDYQQNGELKGKPINLLCDLDAQPSRKDGIYGICTPR